MDLVHGLALVGYYVLAGVVLWAVVTRDYRATLTRAESDPTRGSALADAFLRRVAVLVGVLAGGGTAVLLLVLDPPLVSGTWIAPLAAADAVVTWVLVGLSLRVLRARFGVDVVAELRGESA